MGKKEDIFSASSLMKSQSILLNTISPLGRVWEYLESLEKDPEALINIDLLNELVKQTITLVGQCHSRGICRRKVKSILKEGSKYLEKKNKVLFGESFQKKLN